MRSLLQNSFIGFLLISLVACTGKKTFEPILISKDVCHYCKMVLTDKRFGAEFVTEKGKVFKFDSIECLGHYLEDNSGLKGTSYVTDSFDFPQMIEFKQAFFFHDAKVRSPMGKGLFAAASEEALKKNMSEPKDVMKWQDILVLVGQKKLESSF